MKNQRSLKDTVPPKNGMEKEISSLTPLSISAGKMHVVCNHCGESFFRFASHVRRRSKNYCSVACRQEGMKVEVHTNCSICHADMIQSPSNAARVITCSKECSSKRRSGPSITRNWPEYKAALKEIKARSICIQCGCHDGPWVVRGLLDGSNATLWCRKCQMKDIQQKANAARIASPKAIEKAKRMLEKYGYAVSSNEPR